jgi:hypothetical protein
MKTTTLVRSLKALAIIAAFVAGSGAQVARAGEVSVYLKSGWFTWDEKLNGDSFIKEKGFMHGAGIANRDKVSALSVAELIEVWGGNLDYDGHDLTNTTELKSDTSYLGTKEELALGFKLAAVETLSFEPFLAVGHKFWIRTRSSEDWNSFYAKAGVSGEWKTAAGTLFVKGGALVPIYTRTHVSLSDAGFTDVVTEPKSQLSGFAEGGIKMGAFAVSLEYEEMAFGESAKVATSRVNAAKGVVVQNNMAFQPESRSDLFSLKLAYSF